MKLIIDCPQNIESELLNGVLNLIDEGGQVERRFVERGINNAELIALFHLDKKVCSSVTIKKPEQSYVRRILKLSQAKIEYSQNLKELGYIVTSKEYEGMKLCQMLLDEILKKVEDTPLFATTRKPIMEHILLKYGFVKTGNTYKTDLNLYVKDDSIK